MKDYRLGDIIEIKHGYAFEGEHITQDDNGIVLVTPGNFRIGGGFQDEKCKFFTGEIPADYILSPGNIIVTMTDLSKEIDTLGYSAIVPSAGRMYLHNQRIGLVSFKSNECFPGYVYFLMRTHYYQRSIANSSTGSTVHHTSPSKIYDFHFQAPDYNTQKRIAERLQAYDDLIENNQKQIKLLEEAAQRLYREWFVDLRFPGHETTPIVDGVPEGWERRRLVDIAEVQYGFAFDGALFNSEKNGMPIIRIRNIPDARTSDYTTEEADEQYLVRNGDIVVGMDGEFHINAWAGETAYLVQRTCRIRPRIAEMNGFLLWAIYEPIKFFEKTVVGATVAHLGKKHIDTIELLIPPAKIYCHFVGLFDKRQLLMNQNVLLAEARDRLLPKLMSGEVEV